MTVPSNEAIKGLEERAQSFAPAAVAERQPTFLSLAPTTSASYPQAPKPRQRSIGPALTAGALAGVAEEAALMPTRRTNSMSSDGSASTVKTQRLRFLKLGPVHWGEHPDEHKGDWHEAVIEEP